MALVMASFVLASCHSDVDLKNIDTQTELELGIALPIGSLHATMGDFLGNGKVANISVDENGIFHFIDTFPIPAKQYHQIDLASYIIKDAATLKFNIADKTGTVTIYGNGTTEYPLEFPMELGMEGINDNLSEERIDSITVTEAKFVSVINVENFDLDWSEIKSVQLELLDQFRRPAGKYVDIPISGQNFGSEIPIDVTNFALCLMKDKSTPGQTVNKIQFKIKFVVCPSNGHNIDVKSDSKFAYNLQVKVIDYEAIWGYFEAGNQMRSAQKLTMDSLWGDWRSVKKLKVRFMEPSIDVSVWHRIAAPLRMYIDYISAIDSLGHATNATWNGIDSIDFDLPHPLCPYSGITDSVKNSKRFSFKPDEGHIDELFDVRPDTFAYSFHLLVDKNPRDDYPWKQHRITKDSTVRGDAIFDVPFKFNTGSELQYTTTVKDINISNISLDSLLASVQVIDSIKSGTLKLILDIKNGIPFDLNAYFTFLDADSVDLGLRLVQDNDSNRIHLPAPTMEKPALEKYGRVTAPSVTRLIVNVEKNDFNRLAETKMLRFDAAITGNPQPCQIEEKTDLTVKIGLSAQIDAIFNFGNDSTKTNK